MYPRTFDSADLHGTIYPRASTLNKGNNNTFPAMRLRGGQNADDLGVEAVLQVADSAIVSSGNHITLRKKDARKAKTYKVVRQHQETRKHYWTRSNNAIE